MSHEGGILLIGYGNPGRMDDGLGPALARAVEAMALPGGHVDSDYQLTVEDAASAAGCEAVIFADASLSGTEPFYFLPVEPRASADFTTHSVTPEYVLGCARDLFGSGVAGYVLGIRGYDFGDFREGLSPRAARNLAVATDFVAALLKGRGFDHSVRGAAEEREARHDSR